MSRVAAAGRAASGPGARIHAWTLAASLAGFLAAAGVACGEAGGEEAAVRRDSAGIEIVESPGVDRPLPWRVERVVPLGGEDEGPASFYEVRSTQVAADRAGRLYVLDGAAGRVVVFDSTGGYLRRFGRKGGGPGELERPWSLAVGPGDTVWVFGFARRGFVRFAPDGSPAETVRLGGLQFFGGAIAATGLGVAFAESGMMDRVEELVVLGCGDTLRLASVSLPEAEEIRFESCPMRYRGLPPLFHPSLVWAARADRIVASAGAGYVVDVFEGGERVASLRRPAPPRPATREMAVAHVGDAMRVRVGGREVVCDAEEAADRREWAEVLPAVGELAAAPDDRVWVRRGGVRGEPAVVDVFGADGAYEGTLPEGTPWPVAFLSSRTYAAIETDEWEVDRVVILRIEEEG